MVATTAVSNRSAAQRVTRTIAVLIDDKVDSYMALNV